MPFIPSFDEANNALQPFNHSYLLTPLERRLLVAIREAAPEWQTRRQIGKRVGKVISSYAFSKIEHLVRLGLIESRRAEIAKGHNRWEYRAKDQS